jgi:glucose/arabinose dehydrogenase
MAVGDGGGSGDQSNNAQTTTALLGKILRLDVHGPRHYAIPPDNPFANGGAPEVFAFGLRNPWRNAFDGDTLYIANVGQESTEEVDAIPTNHKGVNFGWRMVEGDECYMPYKCDKTGTVLPIFTYKHLKSACSNTGGYV